MGGQDVARLSACPQEFRQGDVVSIEDRYVLSSFAVRDFGRGRKVGAGLIVVAEQTGCLDKSLPGGQARAT